MSSTGPRRSSCRLALVIVGGLASAAALAQQADAPLSVAVADPHAMHEHATSNNAIQRSVAQYYVPPVKMLRADGAHVSLDKELDDGRPVIMNFVYTSCTTICPMSSQEFSRLQERLGADAKSVHLVSVSIDPEEDTPARLLAYSKHFHAGSEWQYYTGTSAASIKVQQAFGVYRGDKMSHAPVTLLRAASGNSWVKLDGFATADDLYAELQALKTAP